MTISFKPAPWLPGPHLQTLWPALTRRWSGTHYRRKRLILDDGDFLDLDWGPAHDGPLVVILHGLEGSSRSGYVGGLMRVLAHRHWQGVVMHFRGCGGEPNRLARSYNAADTGDLARVMDRLAGRWPHRALYVVGFSLGGNVLLKWLGETPDDGLPPGLRAAVAVSVPFLLGVAARCLDRGFSRLYQAHLLRHLRASYRRKFSRLAGGPVDLTALTGLKNFFDFDDRVTAPLHGFDGAEHYYRVGSCRPWLRHISRPTLLIQARDDPFMDASVIPDPATLSPAVILEVHERGGHVGFVEGLPWRPDYYLERRIPAFLAAHGSCLDHRLAPGDHRTPGGQGIQFQ